VIKSSPVNYLGGDLADSVLDNTHAIVELAARRALSFVRDVPGNELSDDKISEIIAWAWRSIREDLIEEFARD